MAHRSHALVALTVLAALGCKRQGERPPSGPADQGSGVASGSSPGAVAVAAASDAAVPASRTKLQDQACKPRVLGPDPGPTKATAHGQPRLGPPGEVADVKDSCVSHAGCKERDHGRCVHQAEHEITTFGQRRVIPAHNECVYDECTSDDECRRTSTYEPRAELVCSCADERNTCTFANCRQDSDCPAPFPCGGWHYCHSAADACRLAQDCKPDEECVYSWDVKHYICQSATHIAPD